jgi:hypothetical protein
VSSPLERLRQETGQAFSALTAARARTARRLAARAALLEDLPLARDATVALMGSWGRRELTGGSDDDYVVLVRGIAPADGWGAAHDTAAAIAERFARDPGGFGAPGRQGVFAEVVYSSDLLKVGLDDDTNTNLTRRMLLVLESVAACHEDVLAGVRRDVIHDYLSDALKDRRPPRFLLNDLVRYWRTIGVDFVAKDRERGGAGWGLRNAKLRTSRKVLFAGGLVPILRCHSLPREQVRPFLMEQLSRPATDRLADAFLATGLHDAGVRCLSAYDRWLGLLGDAGVRAELASLDRRSARASETFVDVRRLAADLQNGLLALLFETQLAPAVREYAIF